MVMTQTDVPKTPEIAVSLVQAIEKGNFYVVGTNNKILKFLTWSEDQTDKGLYVFVNNLWIDKEFRSKDTLLEIRDLLRGLYPNAINFYWHNNRRDKLRYRR